MFLFNSTFISFLQKVKANFRSLCPLKIFEQKFLKLTLNEIILRIFSQIINGMKIKNPIINNKNVTLSGEKNSCYLLQSLYPLRYRFLPIPPHLLLWPLF